MREGIAVFGEIGLTGRLRTAAQSERRLEECAKLGLARGRRARGDAQPLEDQRVRFGHARDALRAGLEAREENPRKSG